MSTAPADSDTYRPATWEKIVGYVVAVWIVLLATFLLWRNEPFADSALTVIMRGLLSLSVAIIGAIIPGFLYVGFQFKGVVIRAGSALALFVLTYLFGPQVVPALKMPEVLLPNHYPPNSLIEVTPTADDLNSTSRFTPTQVTFYYRNDTGRTLRLFVYDFCKANNPPENTLTTPIAWQSWEFEEFGRYRNYHSFKRTNGWFGFVVGWLNPSGEFAYQFLATKNIFYSNVPTLTVTTDDLSKNRFSVQFAELEDSNG